MGANFITKSFDPSSSQELTKAFEKHQEEERYENGNDGYSGHIGLANGLQINSKTFKDYDSAEEWLSNNTQKWGSAIAVKVGSFENAFPKTESEKKLSKAFQELETSLTNWDKDIIKRVKAGKSLQRSCTKCDSKISVLYIKDIYCPVCSNSKFLKTETDDKKFLALQTKYKAAKSKIDAAKQKTKGKNDAYWLVGAVCAS